MAAKKKENISIKNDITQRMIFVFLLVFFFALVVVFQILFLQNWNTEKWEKKEITFQHQTLSPMRGDICARDGRILATSMPSYSVHLDFTVPSLTDTLFNSNIDSLAECLANLFKDKNKKAYLQELKKVRRKKHRYYLFKSNLSFNQLKQMKKFPIFNRGRYRGGLIDEQKTVRVYPHKNLALRTIGYVNKGDDLVGIEGAFNDILSGKKGLKLMQKLSSGDWRPVAYENDIEPEDGRDVITTIDVNMQDIVEKSLLNQLKQNDAQQGTAILMEVKTGKIRAIANLSKKDDHYIEKYNYAIGFGSEPGSTFKLASMIVALEKGDVDIYDKVHTGNGVLKFKDFSIKDTKRGGHGTISVKRVFEVSSNVGVAKIIMKSFGNDPEEFVDRLFSMNLNKKTGIAIRGEPKPFIQYPGDEHWSGVSLAQVSIGYEVKITPLQTLTLYNAVANNGVMLKPQILEGIREHGEIKHKTKPIVTNPAICSDETLEKIKLLLKGVVENGTAHNLKNPNYQIAGKTGTAQLASGSGGYRDEEKGVRYQASFAGYFPADKPKYSCIVVIYTPTNQSYYGNVVAGPVFKDIADQLYALDFELQTDKIFELEKFKDNPEAPYSKSGYKNHLNKILEYVSVPVEYKNEIKSSWVFTKALDKSIQFTPQLIKKGVVPNVVGMGARDAVYLLENAGLKVKVIGRGMVRKQSIPSGEMIKKGSVITLELNS